MRVFWGGGGIWLVGDVEVWEFTLYIYYTREQTWEDGLREKMGYMRRDIMWLRISLCDVLHSASRVHVVYSCVFVYEYSLMLESWASGLRTPRKPRRKQVDFMPSLNSGLRLALVGFTHITQTPI